MAERQFRSILIGAQQCQILMDLVKRHRSCEFDALYDELDAATLIPDSQIPDDVVAMDDRVTFIDTRTGVQSTCRIVYPHQVADTKDGISVLAPVGAALIGLRVGQTISWALPGGREVHLKVIKVETE